MSTIKVDTIATRTGSGNITLSNSLASATVAGDLTVDTSTLKVDSSNNRVGIGTTSPNANTKLDVNGAARIGNSTDGIMIENNTGSFAIIFCFVFYYFCRKISASQYKLWLIKRIICEIN